MRSNPRSAPRADRRDLLQAIHAGEVMVATWCELTEASEHATVSILAQQQDLLNMHSEKTRQGRLPRHERPADRTSGRQLEHRSEVRQQGGPSRSVAWLGGRRTRLQSTSEMHRCTDKMAPTRAIPTPRRLYKHDQHGELAPSVGRGRNGAALTPRATLLGRRGRGTSNQIKAWRGFRSAQALLATPQLFICASHDGVHM